MCLSRIIKILQLIFIFIINFTYFSFYALAQTPTEINSQGQIPRAEFDSTRYDFGDIYRGQRLLHTYKFQNTGNGTLVFSNIHAACGCMNTKIYADDGKTAKNIFKPNETGVVNVEFNSQDFSGNLIRTITLETNMGSSSPTVTLTVTANVLQELTSNPSLLYVGKIQGEIQKSYNITMNLMSRAKSTPKSENNSKLDYILSEISNSKIADTLKESILSNLEPLKIIAVESSVPYIKVKLAPTITGQPPQIIVQFDEKSLPIGSINAKIKVWNNSTYYKNFEIPVIGESVGHVQVSAKYVEFGVVNGSRPSERVITLRSMNKGFTVTGVKVDLKKLPELKNIKDSELFEVRKDRTIHPQATSDGSVTSYLVSFKLFYPKKLNSVSSDAQGAPGVNVSGFFVVKTNDPDYKEISVPFFGVLRKEP
ncbi:DUF1573 domain-containing protein [Silvanigrella aquatica]|uniref:DUF1573 domain-containing protein n=1 Tax=Silvanigrella aquatica TaxID=1915309 RepID=A0A1L4D252_9BACT|nr:DUF1573 domain-containing protein [Silvanigrella aquatica]APJ04276.1 hypothetical protein AXG55_10310 [Silvanigrella aquatica]